VRIITIPFYQAGFKLVQSYALAGDDGVVLIDTGLPGQVQRVSHALNSAGHGLADVRLILLTHAHYDHAGNAAELKRLSRAPLALHAAEAERLVDGDSGTYFATSRRHRASTVLINQFAAHRYFPAALPDILLGGGESLADYGIAGQVIHSPGHTAGSLSVHLPGQRALFAGDALTGGWFGGHVEPWRPNYPAYSEDAGLMRASAAALLSLCRDGRIYVGHGGPLCTERLRRRLGRAAFAESPTYPHAL
jgi:glyoxylase-like metal-dependent hydrolase (beta-lactamase superfamily II)